MTHGIVLLFDDETTERAIGLSQEYRGDAKDPDFCLGRERNVPHLSLIHLELDDEHAVGKVSDRLPRAAETLKGKALTGTFSSIRGFGTWLFWQTPFTPALLALHERTVDLCAPLRSRPLPTSTKWMTPTQLRMYKAYGCWFVRDAWNPHLTLQVLRADRAGLDGGENVKHWHATGLVLARMGEHGSVQEVIHRVAL